MRRRHPNLPRLWLLTDERQGEGLWNAIRRMPPGSGVIVRHYSLTPREREELFRRIRRVRRGLVLAWSGSAADALRLRADAVYGADARRSVVSRLWPVHGRAEIVAAERAGAALLLLSPVFPTRSHPGARSLGPARFGLLANGARVPVIALGGMTSERARRVRGAGAAGWAAIDGLGGGFAVRLPIPSPRSRKRESPSPQGRGEEYRSPLPWGEVETRGSASG